MQVKYEICHLKRQDMGVLDDRVYSINTGWLETVLGTHVFRKGPAGKRQTCPPPETAMGGQIGS